MSDYEKNSKKELIKVIEDQEQIILDLQIKIENSINKDGRKFQVLELLKEYESMSILDISKKLNISTKNVSSQLTYLRSDGYQIFTNPQGRKVLMENIDTKAEAETETETETETKTETKVTA